jgi:hypothetical protein
METLMMLALLVTSTELALYPQACKLFSCHSHCHFGLDQQHHHILEENMTCGFGHHLEDSMELLAIVGNQHVFYQGKLNSLFFLLRVNMTWSDIDF